MEPTTAILGGGGALGVMVVYWLFKRLRKSTCAIDHCSGCLSINIPEDSTEFIRKKTDRLEKIISELALQIQPKGESTLPKSPAKASLRNDLGTQN
jgi:hypothetical protein